MKNTTSKFQVLVSSMEVLNETEKGKLKGGITTLYPHSLKTLGTNANCVEVNVLFCGKNKPKEPEIPKEE